MKMLGGWRWVGVATTAMAALTVMGPISVDACIDVGTPPGTGVEWDRGLMRPVTTDVGIVPRPISTPDRPPGERDSVVAAPPRPVVIPAQGLYGFFNILTPDLGIEVVFGSPAVTRSPNRGDVTTGPEIPELAFDYPPAFPTELVWDGLCTALRMQLHPEIISDSSTYAHLLSLGEPCTLGIAITGTQDLQNWATMKIGALPNPRPTPPTQGLSTPFDRLVARLATVELASGYPYMLDPNYCRRLLSLDVEAAPALIACTRSPHVFLRRNATAVLGSLPPVVSREALRNLVADSDLVVAVRALKGLAQYADPVDAEFFARLLDHREPAIRTVACYALGRCKGGDQGPRLRQFFLRATDPLDRERLWDALPALARCGTDDRTVTQRLKSLLRHFAQRFPAANAPPAERNPRFPNQATNPESVGFHNRVLWEMTLMALVSAGDEEALQQLFTLAPLTAIHHVNWYLFIDTLARQGTAEAMEILKAFLLRAPETVATYIIQNLAEMGVDVSWLESVVMERGRPAIMRMHALVAIARLNRDKAKALSADLIDRLPIPNPAHPDPTQIRLAELREIMLEIARDHQKRNNHDDMMRFFTAQTEYLALMTTPAASSNSPTARAYFYHTVLAVGGAMGAFTAEKLTHITRQLFLAGTHAKRIGENDLYLYPDIQVFPPLLETAVFELGRTADVRALPVLIEILNARLPYGSAEAAIVLGNFRYRSAISALLDSLTTANGWIRFCAYRALRQISGEDFLADWFYGSTAEHTNAARRYRRWYDDTFNK